MTVEHGGVPLDISFEGHKSIERSVTAYPSCASIDSVRHKASDHRKPAFSRRPSLSSLGVGAERFVSSLISLNDKVVRQASTGSEQPRSPLTPRSLAVCREISRFDLTGAEGEQEDAFALLVAEEIRWAKAPRPTDARAADAGREPSVEGAREDRFAALASEEARKPMGTPGPDAGGEPDVGGCLPELVSVPPDEFSLRCHELYGEAPGEFLRCAVGTTHFLVEGSGSSLAVVAHGVADNLSSFSDISSALVGAGFRVARYDLLGHGWSHMRGGLECSLDALLLQLRLLLDHLLMPQEPLGLFVGHSTGAVVGIAAALKLPELDGRCVDRLGLVSPALWKSLPTGLAGMTILASEQLPSLTRWFASTRSSVTWRVARWLMFDMLCDAFGRDVDEHTGEMTCLHAGARDRFVRGVVEAVGRHPQLFDACVGVITSVLREDVMEETRRMLKSLVAGGSRHQTTIGVFWGTHDAIVDFGHSHEIASWPGGLEVSVVPLPSLGHASPLEKGDWVGEEIVKWLDESVVIHI